MQLVQALVIAIVNLVGYALMLYKPTLQLELVSLVHSCTHLFKPLREMFCYYSYVWVELAIECPATYQVSLLHGELLYPPIHIITGLPDPFAKIVVDGSGQCHSTESIKSTLDPKWNQHYDL